MCNACVLIVKRWRKLPRNNKKDWAHIVDAKGGTGAVGKGSGRKRLEDSEEKLEKIRRKFKVKTKSSRKLDFSKEAKSAHQKRYKAKSRIDLNLLTDFFDPGYWRRKTTCCGPVYVGLEGEVMVNRAEQGQCGQSQAGSNSLSRYISAELKLLTDGEVADEGFYDKTSTNPSSPESVQTVLEDLESQ